MQLSRLSDAGFDGCGVMPDSNAKPWYLSKTIWVNSLTAAVAVLTTISGSDLIADHPSIAAGIVTLIGVANIVLRVITSKPIGG